VIYSLLFLELVFIIFVKAAANIERLVIFDWKGCWVLMLLKQMV